MDRTVASLKQDDVDFGGEADREFFSPESIFKQMYPTQQPSPSPLVPENLEYRFSISQLPSWAKKQVHCIHCVTDFSVWGIKDGCEWFCMIKVTNPNAVCFLFSFNKESLELLNSLMQLFFIFLLYNDRLKSHPVKSYFLQPWKKLKRLWHSKEHQCPAVCQSAHLHCISVFMF